MADERANLKAADKEAKAKASALDAAVKQIEKDFGAGSVMKLGERNALPIEAIPTGALSLDLALGIGGVPRGRIVEIFGPESSGKTTLVYHIIAEAQARGGVCAFVDAEHALDPIYAKRIGVDTDELLISQPDYGEQALEIVDVLVRSGAVDVVAVDSVAALTPRVELEGQMGEQTVGLQARLMSQALRKLAGNLNRAKTVCLFTNQIREKIGVMFGSPETQPGGRALKFYCSQRLDMRRIETLKEGTEAVGNRVRVKVVKNKVAAPFRQAEFDIEYGDGISHEGCLLDLALEHDLVQKSGSFFSYGELRLGQGRNNTKQYLAENPELATEIETKLFAELGIERTPRAPRVLAEAPEPDEAPKPPRPSPRPPRTPSPSARPRSRAGMAPDAFERALEALGHRERTTAELGEWLAARGFEPAEVEVAIERLIEAGALDDERFAARFAEDKRELRGWGPERIRGALAARGAGVGDDRRGRSRATSRRASSQRALELLERRSEAPVDEALARPGAGLPRATRIRVRARLRGGQGARAPARRLAERSGGAGRLRDRRPGATIVLRPVPPEHAKRPAETHKAFADLVHPRPEVHTEADVVRRPRREGTRAGASAVTNARPASRSGRR